MKYEIVPATREHVEELAAKMRQEDVDEVWAFAHLTPLEAVQMSFDGTLDAQAGLADGELVCIFGVVRDSILSETGYPWLLCTPLVKKHAMAFLRRTKDYMTSMRQKFWILENYGDARNVEALRWMKWLGFDVLEAQPFGVEKLPFHKFEMRNY